MLATSVILRATLAYHGMPSMTFAASCITKRFSSSFQLPHAFSTARAKYWQFCVTASYTHSFSAPPAALSAAASMARHVIALGAGAFPVSLPVSVLVLSSTTWFFSLFSERPLSSVITSPKRNMARRLGLVMTRDNGRSLKIEKNHVVELSTNTETGNDTVNAPAPRAITWRAMLAAAESAAGGAEKLWVYDAITQNCQAFARAVLKACGSWNEELNLFVMQDAAKVIEGMPWYAKAARKITDVAING